MTDIYVPAVGPANAKIVIVGEAPGESEVRAGAPFIGTSGNLLTSTLASVGLKRDDIFITNVCHYRPPKNEIMQFFLNKKRMIPNDLVARGMAELYLDLARIKPNVVVPMGNVALWALTGEQEISKRRGSIMPATISTTHVHALDHHGLLNVAIAEALPRLHGMKVIPTLHPAHVLRKYLDLVLLKTDLRRVLKDSTFPELRLPERTYIIDPTEEEMWSAIEHILEGPVISYDIECVNNGLYCVGFSNDPSWALVLSADKLYMMQGIRTILSSPIPKVAQNGIFDMTYLQMKEGIIVNNYAFDTMVGQHCAYPELSKGLDTITSIYTREPYYKDEGKNWSPKDVRDALRFKTYNAKDVCVTLEAMQAMLNVELKRPSVRGLHDRIIKEQIPIYAEMITGGILVDLARQQELHDTYTKDAQELQRALDQATIERLLTLANASKPARKAQILSFVEGMVKGLDTEQGGLNVNSSPMLQTFLYDILQFKPKKGKNNTPTVDEDALLELYAETGDIHLLTIIQIKKKRKRLSSYLRLKTTPEGRTFYSMNPVRAETGRSSSGKTIEGFGANMQTWPHEIRDMFIAEPGYLLGYFDYSQAEGRIVAYKGGVKRMIQEFEDPNGDIHKLTASAIFGIPIEEVQEYPHRFLGKTSNHAYNYEMGHIKFWRIVAKRAEETGVRITRSQAKSFRDAHFRLYPELRFYWEKIREQVRKDRTIVNPFGRSRVFLGRMNEDTFREAYSHYAQSTVADLVRAGMVNAQRDNILPLRKEFPHTRILLEVHDALLIQFPESELRTFVPAVIKSMTIPFPVEQHQVTIPVDCKYGPSFEKKGSWEKWRG